MAEVYPPNLVGIQAIRTPIVVAGVSQRLPYMEVPDGMALLIRAWWTNGGQIYVGGSDVEATNINQIWPLLQNEVVGYYVQNAEQIFISGTLAGDFVVITTERSKKWQKQ